MAKRLTHKRTTTEKVTIKGWLSDDATTVTYDEDKEEKTVTVQDYLNKFASMDVEIVISSKSDEDLSDEE